MVDFARTILKPSRAAFMYVLMHIFVWAFIHVLDVWTYFAIFGFLKFWSLDDA